MYLYLVTACRWIGRVDTDATIDTRVVSGGRQSHLSKDFCELVVPVLGAAAQTIQRLVEESKFIFVSSWVPSRWAHCNALIVWQRRLTERVLAVALLERVPFLNGFRDHEAQAGLLEHWIVML